jgi:hypothetical protein
MFWDLVTSDVLLRFTKFMMLKINTNVCAKMTARDTQQLGSLDD